MKKLILIPLVVILIQFQARPAAVVYYPGEILLSALLSCGAGPKVRTLGECIGFAFKAPVLTARTGVRFLRGTFSSSGGLVIYTSDRGPGFIGKVLGAIVGVLLLDQSNGQLRLTKLDEANLPATISLSEARVYNQYTEEVEVLINEANSMLEHNSGQKEFLSNLNALFRDAQIPPTVDETLLKLFR